MDKCARIFLRNSKRMSVNSGSATAASSLICVPPPAMSSAGLWKAAAADGTIHAEVAEGPGFDAGDRPPSAPRNSHVARGPRPTQRTDAGSPRGGDAPKRALGENPTIGDGAVEAPAQVK